MDAQHLTRLLALRFLYKKKTLHSSHALHRLFTTMGVFTMEPSQLLAELEQEGLIQHEGFFDATSGLLKNVSLTDKGIRVAEENPVAPHAEALNQEFNGFSKYQDFF